MAFASLNKPTRVNFPGFYDEVAQHLGKMRNDTNLQLMAAHPQYSRPKQNVEVNILGVRAELVARYALYREGIQYDAPRLVDERPVPGPDLYVGQTAVDVKGVPPGKNYLSVNDQAHEKQKGIDMYLFVHFLGPCGVADLYLVAHDVVTSWGKRQLRYTPAYCYDLPKRG